MLFIGTRVFESKYGYPNELSLLASCHGISLFIMLLSAPNIFLTCKATLSFLFIKMYKSVGPEYPRLTIIELHYLAPLGAQKNNNELAFVGYGQHAILVLNLSIG